MMQSRYQQAAARGSRFINFTNFGVPVEQAYGVGPIQYAPGILVALSTYRKKAHFVVQGNDSVKFQPFIHAFLTNIVTDLEQAASG